MPTRAGSGHADAAGLVAWAKDRLPVTGSVFIAHGEPDAAEGLRRRLIEADFAAERLVIPALDEGFALLDRLPAEIMPHAFPMHHALVQACRAAGDDERVAAVSARIDRTDLIFQTLGVTFFLGVAITAWMRS